jgi:glycosyltransferase involved in cell wall biosynthesis
MRLSLINVIKYLLSSKVVQLPPIGGECKGNVLLSYIVGPFLEKTGENLSCLHTNQWECLKIATIWREFGYAVDVINWDNKYFTPKRKYSVFIDIHSNMERLTPLLNKNCFKILHITGAHWLFQNRAEYNRLLSIQKRRGVTLAPRRLASPSMGIEFADCATILGNEFTISTFRYANKPVYRVPISTTIQYPWFEDKNYDKCKNKFLWFGGSGLVLKGLDLVLEAFSQMHGVELTVCGPIKSEKDFEQAFFKELYQTQNIKTIGWVDVGGDTFLEIIKNNLGLIYPASSEGGGGSVIQCLHAGLVPIISYQSSVDVAADFGVILNKCTVDEIIESIEAISGLQAQELKLMSRRAWEFARAHHTRDKFASEYSKFVKQIIDAEELHSS